MVEDPTEIEEYKILRPLGRGGMGAVFLARDRSLDRLVAIKMIDRGSHRPDAVARFRVEARALARLAHANVVTVHRIGDHGGRPFIVYEYVEGASLDRRARPLPFAEAVAIARGLARGLAAAHREGILHRDLKPGNAMVATDGTVKLLDFGLAKLGDGGSSSSDGAEARASRAREPARPSAEAPTEPGGGQGDAGARPAAAASTPATRVAATPAPGEAATPATAAAASVAADAGRAASTLTFDGGAAAPIGDSLALTRVGSRMGTPRYMAPEAWRGEVLTAASDVYSLGLVLWELFADRHPFEGVALDALPARACDEDLPSIASAAPALPAALVTLIDRCVRRAPSARPADGAAVLAALDAFAPGEAPGAAPAPRRRGWIAVGVVGAVAAVGAASLRWWPRGDAAVAASPTAGGAGATAAGDRTAGSAGAGPTAGGAGATAGGAGATTAGGSAAAVPRALTRLGGCAETPAFVDASTIAFSLMKGEDVDIYTWADGAVTRLTTSPGWDWRAATGRHPGELLYVRDGDDGRNRMAAYSRAAATDRELGVGYAVVAAGDDVYYLTDDAVGELRRRSAAGDALVTALPAGRSPETLAVSPDGRRVGVVVADRDSPPGVCVVDVAAPAPRCLETIGLQMGRPAFSGRGRYLYYPARTGLRRVDLEAGGDVLIAPELRAAGGVALSPDGSRLVYSDCRSYGSIVAIAPAPGAVPEVVLDEGQAKHPRGGPDGALAYVTPRDQGGTRLWWQARGAPARELFADDGELGAPRVDAAGARLAFSRSGATPGLHAIAIAGGAIERWTDDRGDRGPTWTRAGGLAFTRLGAGGVPSAMVVAAPGARPRLLAAGWTVHGTDGATGAILALREGKLALLDPARPLRGTPRTLRLGPAEGNALAVVDGGAALYVLGGASGAALYAVDRETGAATLLRDAPAGQTVGPPTVLSDGRIAYRAEIWLGELYELPAPEGSRD